MKSPWWKHGFWNTLEHAVTRALDALISIVLIRGLATDQFSKLAVAQAVVAPLLLFFVAPGVVIYRDYARWKAEGSLPLAARLRAFRLYGMGLGQLSIALSAAIAWGIPGHDMPIQRFWALIWAFALTVGAQLSGADREFLRLELRLRELNFITLFQKLLLLSGVWLVLARWNGRVDLLALVAAVSMVLSSQLARWRVTARLGPGLSGPAPVAVVAESLRSFSVWSHLSGVVTNWTQTMDLLFLGAFRMPAQVTGLYGAALKLSGLAQAGPLALANLFSIWTGRRGSRDRREELKALFRLTLVLFALAALGSAVLLLLSPWLVEWLSRGRWSPEEQASLLEWFRWILLGSMFFGSTFLISTWLTLREKVSGLFLRVYAPWGAGSVAIYAWSASKGPDLAARANLVVALVFAALLLLELRRVTRR